MAKVTFLGVIIASILIVTAILSPRTEPASAGITTLPGDANCNGVVAIEDAQLIAQFVVGRIGTLSCGPPGPTPTLPPSPTPSPTLQAGEVRALALAYISGDDAPFPYDIYIGWSCSNAKWMGTHWLVSCSGGASFSGVVVRVHPEVCVYEQTLLAAVC